MASLLLQVEIGQANELSSEPKSGSANLDWLRKPVNVQRLIEEKSILVSVKSSNDDWSLSGAGLVSARIDFVNQAVFQASRLKAASSQVEAVRFLQRDAKSGSFEVQFQILGKIKKMTVEIEQVPGMTGPSITYHWRVLLGAFAGSKGSLVLIDRGQHAVLVEFQGQHHEGIRWVPNFILAIAVEGFMKSVATSWRKNLESDYLHSIR